MSALKNFKECASLLPQLSAVSGVQSIPLPHYLNCINYNFSKSSKELIKFWFANYFSIWLELAANHLWKFKVNLSLTFANRDFNVEQNWKYNIKVLCVITNNLFLLVATTLTIKKTFSGMLNKLNNACGTNILSWRTGSKPNL